MAKYEITGIMSTGYKSAYQQGYSDAMRDFRKKPKTGQWEICQDDDGMYGICNICGKDSDFYYYGEVYMYCPNCGAKMESEDKE